MKLLCVTESYGGRVMVRPSGWGDAIFFAGRQPLLDTLLLLDMPGLTAATVEASVQWLSQRQSSNLLNKLLPTRRQVNELPSTVWRLAVLDDTLDVDNYQAVLWRLNRYFKLEQFSAFGERYLPEAQRRLRAVLAVQGDAERVRAFGELQTWLERVTGVFAQSPTRMTVEREAAWQLLDEARVAALRAGPFSVQLWADAARQTHTHNVQVALLGEIASRVAQAGGDTASILKALEPVSESLALRQLTEHAPWFWNRLERVVRLEPNLSGATIDITSAQEQTVQLSWELIAAQRVGTIVPGRAALIIDDEGEKTYIAGQRRLKFQVARAGGRLEKFGNTLVTGTGGANAMHQALLDVDMLDTLANVDPAQALERIHHLRLPADHPVYRAAAAARQDGRQSRVLADLLIELVVGVDADIVRRLARAQARANRR